MSIQKFFNYKFPKINDYNNFFVNSTNYDSFFILNNTLADQNIFLYGPDRSGKTHLVNIWKKNNNAILYNNNFNEIIKTHTNVVIDNIIDSKHEEEVFHIINHCKLFNLNILITSSIELVNLNLNLKDLYSRLRSFLNININQPDDEMCKILMTKFFYEKQIIVKNIEIFDFIINRIDRTYKSIYILVEKIDKLSLEKKRELTIPLIKEIL